MSDLAPFVAAALRDKVFQELLEENAKLRKQLAGSAKENHKVVVRDALHGFDGVYRIAIVRQPTAVEADNNNNENEEEEEEANASPTVYAVEHFHRSATGGYEGGPFQTIQECTLGDLLQAQVFINGASTGPVRHKEVHFSLSIQNVDAFKADFTSLEDALDSISWPATDNTWASFAVVDINGNIGMLWFDLTNVPKRRLLEFAEVNPDEFLANPRPLDVVDRDGISIAEMATFFGDRTIVVFDQSGEIH